MIYTTKRPTTENSFVGDIDKFFGSLFNENEECKNSTVFFPVDITESKEGYRIEAEIPGVEENEIKATVDGTLLTISAKNGLELKEGEKSLLKERRRGSFTRSFNLPKEADSEAIAAEFANGVLTLTLPKKEQAKPRDININIKTKDQVEEKEAVNEKKTK